MDMPRPIGKEKLHSSYNPRYGIMEMDSTTLAPLQSPPQGQETSPPPDAW